ncbi:MAG: hypothetical protein LUD27_00610 [Clostridia bacterium]|nr:hypothetical protein [Clostridia bacterium]
MFKINSDTGKVFGVDIISSDDMKQALKSWNEIVKAKPIWAGRDDIKTVNIAGLVSDTRAKLTTLDIGITVSGSPRAEYLQKVVDKMLKVLPDRLSDGDSLGGMMIKFNGDGWDFVLPGNFGITAVNGEEITGAIFATNITRGINSFTRLEYHRFEGDIYKVSNKAFRNSRTASGDVTLGVEVDLTTVSEWAEIIPEAEISGLEHPLFAYYRVPGTNIVDRDSPLGLSVFAKAIAELRATDIAISRKDTEIEDSKHLTFVGQALVKNAQAKNIDLPRFVVGLGMGVNDNDTSAIHEHVPTIQTDARIKDINFNLSLVGVKCGFSAGYFVLDGQTGMITATQVEADDRDTIQTIKTERDALRTAIEQAIYGADALATLYNLAPIGSYELNFNFGDITYNYEEDKASWRYYVSQGWMPIWKYFVKFEGMSEEEAKALVAEAADANMTDAAKRLFDSE